MDEFQWDEANTEHIARHGVTTDEAEEAYSDPKRVNRTANRAAKEPRRVILGKTGDGRILFVVFTLRVGTTRVVTARDATADEKKQYRRR